MLAPVTVKSLSTVLASASGLDAVPVVVVLSASAVAELFVLTGLAGLAFFSRVYLRSVRDDAAAVLAPGQLAGGGNEPIELKVHHPEEVAYTPTSGELVYRKQRLLLRSAHLGNGRIGENAKRR
jgi:hypothetical protein